MSYQDLRDFMAQLEATGELRRVAEPVSPHLEMTALSDRVLRASGAIYGVRLLQALQDQPGIEAHAVVSDAGWRPPRLARCAGAGRRRAGAGSRWRPSRSR